MRTLLGVGLVLALACGATAAEKVDAAKLVGKWKMAGEKMTLVVEFTTDSKVSGTVTHEGKDRRIDGTYKLEANKLTITSKIGEDKEKTRTVTITKLTDNELETQDEGGVKDRYTRVKAGKP